MASAYSVRATPDARVSTPLHWDEVPGCRPEQFTIDTVGGPVRRTRRPVDRNGRRRPARWTGCWDSPRNSARRERAPRGAKPLIEVARTKTRDEAMAALDDWRRRHPEAAALLQPADVLVDGMRGPSSIWYRIRINLQHVPTGQRPPQEDLIADYSPWSSRTREPRR